MSSEARTTSSLLPILSRVASSPLSHLLILLGLVVALVPAGEDSRVIRIDSTQVREVYAEKARRQRVRRLTEEAQQEALDEFVRDEMLYREALRLELDQDDSIIRNRLVQKMLFYVEDAAAQADPSTEENIRAYYESEPDRWRIPAAFRLDFVFFAPAGTSDARARAREARQALEQTSRPEVDKLGDPFPLTRNTTWNSTLDVARDFGQRVADAALELPIGEWSEPVHSTYGWFLLKVRDRKPEHRASFDRVRKDVTLAFEDARKRRALEEFHGRLERDYEVGIVSESSSAP